MTFGGHRGHHGQVCALADVAIPIIPANAMSTGNQIRLAIVFMKSLRCTEMNECWVAARSPWLFDGACGGLAPSSNGARHPTKRRARHVCRMHRNEFNGNTGNTEGKFDRAPWRGA
jgi:hypothetical protein